MAGNLKAVSLSGTVFYIPNPELFWLGIFKQLSGLYRASAKNRLVVSFHFLIFGILCKMQKHISHFTLAIILKIAREAFVTIEIKTDNINDPG